MRICGSILGGTHWVFVCAEASNVLSRFANVKCLKHPIVSQPSKRKRTLRAALLVGASVSESQ